MGPVSLTCFHLQNCLKVFAITGLVVLEKNFFKHFPIYYYVKIEAPGVGAIRDPRDFI